MKKHELEELNLKSFLTVCYDDLEPHLMQELNQLRFNLIKLSDDSSEKQILAQFETCVEALNAMEDNRNIESGIDTEEREALCEVLYQMGDIVGLDSSTDYVDNWRDW